MRLYISMTEKFTVSGGQLVEKRKQLIHERDIRRVRILHEGRTVPEIPVSVGALAAALSIMMVPVPAGSGPSAALVT